MRSLIATIVAFVFLLGAQVVVWRVVRPAGHYLTLAALYLVSLGLTVALCVAVAPVPSLAAWIVPAGLREWAGFLLLYTAVTMAYMVTYSAVQADSPSPARRPGGGARRPRRRAAAARGPRHGIARQRAGRPLRDQRPRGPARRPLRRLSRALEDGEGRLTVDALGTLAVVAAPLIGLFVCFVAHVAVSRTAPGIPRQNGLLIAVLAGALAVTAIVTPALRADLARGPAADAWGAMAVSLLAYLGFGYCYVIGFFNIGESARRIRLLIELFAARGRGLTVPEVLAVYNAQMVLDARLYRLLVSGQIAERDGRYFLRRRAMLYGARALVLLKIVLLRRRAEPPLEVSAAGRGGAALGRERVR
jgi:hypothetical protein